MKAGQELTLQRDDVVALVGDAGFLGEAPCFRVLLGWLEVAAPVGVSAPSRRVAQSEATYQ